MRKQDDKEKTGRKGSDLIRWGSMEGEKYKLTSRQGKMGGAR